MYALGVSSAEAPVYKAIIIILIVTIQSPAFKSFVAKRRAKTPVKEVAAA